MNHFMLLLIYSTCTLKGFDPFMVLQESGENYLETILILGQRLDRVRSVDVANELGFSKPSISRAMSLLRQNGYVTVDGNGGLHLTDQGKEVASRIYERHQVLSQALTILGVDADTAAQDACRIEHIISQESFDKIKEHIKGKTQQ